MAFTATRVGQRIYFETNDPVDEQVIKRINIMITVFPQVIDRILTVLGDDILGRDLTGDLGDTFLDPYAEIYPSLGQNFNFFPRAHFKFHPQSGRLYVDVSEWALLTDDPLPT